MKLQFFIALRYLFSKKSYNIINIISMICAGGICVATLALVCTLSVYNGFQQLISDVISSFDPDIKITIKEGKTFDPTLPLNKLKTLDCIQTTCEILEENALIRHKDKQTSVILKGVSNNYTDLIPTSSITDMGSFLLEDNEGVYTVLGTALFNQINGSISFTSPISLYAPKYATKVNVANPENSFNVEHVYIGGTYATHQLEIDSKYAFLPIKYAQELFEYGNVVSAIELNIKEQTDIQQAQNKIKELLGNDYVVSNKEQQHEEFYRMMKIEKWITFLILFFILLIAIVNVIGSLSMLILEKKKDIVTLQNLGATQSFIQQLFLIEGWMISAIGAFSGIVLGVILCLSQQLFGWLKLGTESEEGTFLINAYPVSVQLSDICLILFSVLAIGILVAWIPSRYIKHKDK